MTYFPPLAFAACVAVTTLSILQAFVADIRRFWGWGLYSWVWSLMLMLYYKIKLIVKFSNCMSFLLFFWSSSSLFSTSWSVLNWYSSFSLYYASNRLPRSCISQTHFFLLFWLFCPWVTFLSFACFWSLGVFWSNIS